MTERSFKLPNNKGVIRFNSDIIDHMYQHAQLKLFDKEAGGQIFSESPEKPLINITKITGPYETDKRSRSMFNPDVQKINQDRINFFKEGFYPVGLWHTHPEKNPKPSLSDKKTTLEYLNAFEDKMHGFLLVILGNSGSPLNMSVWLATNESKNSWVQLKEIL